jgi:Porin PorA
MSVRNVFTRSGAGTNRDEDGPNDGPNDGATEGPPPSPGPGTAKRRGRLHVVLAGAGAFLLVAGLLLRFYAAPQLIAAPVDLYEQDTLVSPHASYFDQGALVTRNNVRLTYTLTVRGDQDASTSTTGVWDSFASLADPQRHNVINTVYQRYAFDRRTGQLSMCCGASVNDSTSVHQSGIGLFWPIGTKKQTYSVFDNNSMKAWPAAYTGEAQDTGVQTYEFVQHVPATLVDQMTGVPTSLLGIPGPSQNVVANRYYQATNTFWVDPRTGVLVDEEVNGQSYLTGPNGQGRLVAVNFDLRMDQTSRQSLADLASKNAKSIAMVNVLGPLGLGVLGLILLLFAFTPWRHLRRHPTTNDDETGPSHFDLLPGTTPTDD